MSLEVLHLPSVQRPIKCDSFVSATASILHSAFRGSGRYLRLPYSRDQDVLAGWRLTYALISLQGYKDAQVWVTSLHQNRNLYGLLTFFSSRECQLDIYEHLGLFFTNVSSLLTLQDADVRCDKVTESCATFLYRPQDRVVYASGALFEFEEDWK